ncbi:HAMP domain-containing protein [Streptomyces sp. AJS327]|uniref:nitrate- and nitrite sensing domain-containing protein n=1 Tax=Streptomyces sp. AJS327 TaxID=2545265 RepID=UPI0015E01D69|nr:nitrate- and nitrite sensing domain-containing protein [Streptomyces sp. AJS327]MBA0051758.1 HAMP domain-containing protein [Streptomyces sp. AJS327]
MQGRFKRNGSAEGSGEPGGSTDRGSSAERAQEGGTAAGREGGNTAEGAAAATADAANEAAVSSGSRLALRNWRISTRLVSLLALPVIAATTLGGMRIHSSLNNVSQLDNMKLLTEMTEQATELAQALQEERDRSAGPLVATKNAKDDTVVGPRERTDQAFQAFKERTASIDDTDKAMAGVQTTVLDITRQLGTIKDIRERAYTNAAYTSQTVNSYNQLISSLLSLSQDMAQATSNSEMIQSTRALAAFSSAKEFASIQRAVISAGLARPGGPELSETDRLYARTAMARENAALGSFEQIYGEERAAGLMAPLDGGVVNIVTADQYRERVLDHPDGIKQKQRSYMDWIDLDKSKLEAMGKIEASLLSQMEEQARELRSEAQREAVVNGVIIFLVLGISLVGAFVVARSMVSSLRRLQDTAQEVARQRLPELGKQMSEAEPQDVDTSVESVGVHSRDEIGKVAAAFDDVHREAVRLAGEQALLRGNVNAMFTNLSRRSQGLIQRQLSLISELESREADPDQLSSLFKLDHLATRMRRNGENLLVLAGEEPGRRWTRPVPLVDVLRAAASEVEQYERIELNSVPSTEVAGRVVNDLVHLLAELLENATSFSSPQTKVKVTGHALPDGRVLIEIHDTGIGLSPEDLSSINERLANPPTVDVSVSRRMGLFVVGRLSLRHGIRIQLRPSDSGGTTALVMLPVDVAQGGAQGPRGKGGPAGGAAGKSGGLAAALQRGPQGGPGGGKGGLSGLHTRGQVSGGAPRAALTGGGEPQGQQSGATSFFGAPPSPPAPGAAPGGASTGERPGGAEARPADVPPALPTRGGPAGELPGAPAHGGSVANGAAPARPGPGDTAEFARPQVGGPGDTGQFARPETAPGDLPREPRPNGVASGPGHPAAPSAPVAADHDTPRGHEEPVSAGQGHHAEPARSGEEFTDPAFGIPAGHAPENASTPIFESMESSWFRDSSGHPSGAVPQQAPPAGRLAEPGPAPGPPQAPRGASPGGRPEQVPPMPQRPMPRRPVPGGGDVGGGGAPESGSGGRWGASPNDESWRQAEAVREPAAGGITTSGLPRRVPRANLVAGTAQQEPAGPSGPQVSRAPDDVRGRLTNLRRGIQQGRQAGTETRGTGPTYQQER